MLEWTPETEASGFGVRRMLHRVGPDMAAGIYECAGFACTSNRLSVFLREHADYGARNPLEDEVARAIYSSVRCYCGNQKAISQQCGGTV